MLVRSYLSITLRASYTRTKVTSINFILVSHAIFFFFPQNALGARRRCRAIGTRVAARRIGTCPSSGQSICSLASAALARLTVAKRHTRTRTHNRAGNLHVRAFCQERAGCVCGAFFISLLERNIFLLLSCYSFPSFCTAYSIPLLLHLLFGLHQLHVRSFVVCWL